MGRSRIPKDQQSKELMIGGSKASTTHPRFEGRVMHQWSAVPTTRTPTAAEIMSWFYPEPKPDPIAVHGPEVRRLLTADFIFSTDEALDQILDEIKGQSTPEARMKAAGEWISRFTNAVAQITREDD